MVRHGGEQLLVLHLPGKALRQLVTQIPALAIGVIEGLTFKGRCYSTLAQMLGTRSITERLATCSCTSVTSTACRRRTGR